MPIASAIALATLVAVLLMMGGEAVLSRFNERLLRPARVIVAREPDDGSGGNA